VSLVLYAARITLTFDVPILLTTALMSRVAESVPVALGALFRVEETSQHSSRIVSFGIMQFPNGETSLHASSCWPNNSELFPDADILSLIPIDEKIVLPPFSSTVKALATVVAI